mgnify:CR=1 FL=1
MVSCTDDDDKDPNFMPPDIVMGGGRCRVGISGGFACSRSFCDVYSVIKCQYVSPYQC